MLEATVIQSAEILITNSGSTSGVIKDYLKPCFDQGKEAQEGLTIRIIKEPRWLFF